MGIDPSAVLSVISQQAIAISRFQQQATEDAATIKDLTAEIERLKADKPES